MKYVKCTEEHAKKLVDIIEQDPDGYGKLTDQTMIPTRINVGTKFFTDGTVLIDDNDKIVGWFEINHFGYKSSCFNLYVVPKHRHEGVGKLLMGHCITLIQYRTEDTKIVNVVYSNNHDSIKLHAKHKFKEVARLKEYAFRYGVVDLIYMELEL